MHDRRKINPSAAALWLCNCHSAYQEMSGHSTGSQFGSCQRILSLRRNYTVAQNQSLPFLEMQAKLQRGKQGQCNFLRCIITADHLRRGPSPAWPAACQAIIRPLDTGNRTTTSGVWGEMPPTPPPARSRKMSFPLWFIWTWFGKQGHKTEG